MITNDGNGKLSHSDYEQKIPWYSTGIQLPSFNRSLTMKVNKLKKLLGMVICLPSLVLADLPPLSAVATLTAVPTPPALTAKSYVLMDFLSDHFIAEQNVDQRVEPASLTKMMTVYVVDHALEGKKIRLEDKVRVSENAWRSTGSRMFLELNSEPTVAELLKGIIIQSGNDASIAIAEHVAGSEATFAELMNFFAKKLGMVNTHFVNATGLPDPNHYTTARDMAVLAKALVRDFPKTYKLYSQKEFVYHNIKQVNRNRLLWQNDGVDGIKTGFTEAAGYCLVASGQKEGTRLIAVVMGTNSENSRSEEANKLLTYGFRFYETRKLYSAKTSLKQAPVWMGKQNEVQLGLAQDLYVTIGKGQYDRLKANVNFGKFIKAPLKEGTVLGSLSVQLEDKTIIERPIVSLAPVEEAGIFGRLYDSIALYTKSLWDKVTS